MIGSNKTSNNAVPMKPKHLTERDGFWHFARRVPTHLVNLDPRGVIKHTTGIAVADDPDGIRAAAVRDSYNSDLEATWRGMARGEQIDAAKRHDETRARARAMGFHLVPAADVANLPMNHILARLDELAKRSAERDPISRHAALGTGPAAEPRPGMLLSELVAAFEDAIRSDIRDYFPNQLRRWRNAKTRAVSNLIVKIGDVAITALTRNDALEYRKYWQQRILTEDLDPDTANKDFGHLSKMLKTIDRLEQLGLEPLFTGLRFEGGLDNQRRPYSRDFVQNTILAPGRLMKMNEDARRVLFLMAGTGLRITECVNLSQNTIRLNCDIPHVRVRPDDRRMKTSESLRDMPLAGVALAAMQAQPTGFRRYHDKASGLSASVNAFLLDNGLRPGEGESLYSLRHTFKDSLINLEAPDSMIDALMGHAEDGEKYGNGATLALKYKWVKAVAFEPPPLV